jgi:hypothetical protein
MMQLAKDLSAVDASSASPAKDRQRFDRARRAPPARRGRAAIRNRSAETKSPWTMVAPRSGGAATILICGFSCGSLWPRYPRVIPSWRRSVSGKTTKTKAESLEMLAEAVRNTQLSRLVSNYAPF